MTTAVLLLLGALPFAPDEEPEEVRLARILARLPEEIRSGDRETLLGEIALLRRFPSREGAVDALASLLPSKDDAVAAAAARALGEGRHPRAAAPLLAAARAVDPRRRGDLAVVLVWALGEVRDPRALDLLLARLRAREVPVAAAAAEALGKTGVRRREVLEALLREIEGLSASYRSSKEGGARGRYEALIGPLVQGFSAIAGRGFSGNPSEMRAWFNENKSRLSLDDLK